MTTARARKLQTFGESGCIGSFIEDSASNMRASLYASTTHPDEWRLYLDQAEESYGTHGVAPAVRREELETEPCPAFWHIEDMTSGEVVGGMRCHGPYPSVEEAWGIQEFAAFPQYEEIAALIEPLIPAGVIENKGAYMAVHARPSHDVASMFVRCMSLSIEAVGAKTLIGTSAQHTLPLWLHAGCTVPRPDLKVPYPDERYETVLAVHETRNRTTLMARAIRVQRIRDIAEFRGEELMVTL